MRGWEKKRCVTQEASNSMEEGPACVKTSIGCRSARQGNQARRGINSTPFFLSVPVDDAMERKSSKHRRVLVTGSARAQSPNPSSLADSSSTCFEQRMTSTDEARWFNVAPNLLPGSRQYKLLVG